MDKEAHSILAGYPFLPSTVAAGMMLILVEIRNIKLGIAAVEGKLASARGQVRCYEPIGERFYREIRTVVLAGHRLVKDLARFDFEPTPAKRSISRRNAEGAGTLQLTRGEAHSPAGG